MKRSALLATGMPAVLMMLPFCAVANATEPSQKRDDRRVGIEEGRQGYTTQRGLRNLTRTVGTNRFNVRAGWLSLSEANASGGIQIRGTRFIPIFPVRFRNTSAEPFAIADLQRQLFDGPWPTGTMSDYYREVSYGAFTVSGTVQPWRILEHDDVYYEGPDTQAGPCNGACGADKVGELLAETFALNDAAADFRRFDNDGADNVPDSGDDDGYVDFVAIVQPEVGGECTPETGVNRNIWSHRFSYKKLTGQDYITADIGNGGAPIRIDDYVIVPARSCVGDTMIQIGVFAHEFGHTFGLPDLYDTDRSNGNSAGIGTWGLMGSGSWGGDNESPHSPSHMSAWEKERLGWLQPTTATADLADAHLHPIEQRPEALKVVLNENEYYLIEYRRQIGFDRSLPGSGLLVWRINQKVILDQIDANRVNADSTNQGVALVQADGLEELNAYINRGDFGDMFRGREGRRGFDASGYPAATKIALCEIGEAGETHGLRLLFSRANCQ